MCQVCVSDYIQYIMIIWQHSGTYYRRPSSSPALLWVSLSPIPLPSPSSSHVITPPLLSYSSISLSLFCLRLLHFPVFFFSFILFVSFFNSSSASQPSPGPTPAPLATMFCPAPSVAPPYLISVNLRLWWSAFPGFTGKIYNSNTEIKGLSGFVWVI